MTMHSQVRLRRQQLTIAERQRAQISDRFAHELFSTFRPILPGGGSLQKGQGYACVVGVAIVSGEAAEAKVVAAVRFRTAMSRQWTPGPCTRQSILL
jgi:hypothetical protein